MRPVDTSSTADALTGAIILAAFALAWTMWGSSRLASDSAAVVRIAAVVTCVVLIGRAAVLRARVRSEGRGNSMFFSTAYRWIVVGEVIALFSGGAILSASGQSTYTILWFALVVGVHFLCFGRVFWTGFYLIGVVLLMAAVAGAVTALAGGSAAQLYAVTGLTAAADLFAASAWTALNIGRL